MAFIGSIQRYAHFEIYSAVDERSAAYMACGIAAESGEPVVLSCTGATASRNYLPGMTEAYYRKLPILAVTSTQDTSKVGHLIPQVIDRDSIQNDVSNLSVPLRVVKDADDRWSCEVNTNKAILELYRNGGGPAHINLTTTYSLPFDVKKLTHARAIFRHTQESEKLPSLKGKVAVFVGSHTKWSVSATKALEEFCEANDAVVFCDHTSGYKGKHRLLFSLAASQELVDISYLKPDVCIHIGEVSGDYPTFQMAGKEVWRVSPDGELKDAFRKLKHIFDMSESVFFRKYTKGQEQGHKHNYFEQCEQYLSLLRSNIPEIPFSNIWVASQVAHRMPENSNLHLGILNSLRSWNFFETPDSVNVSSNVGGFGIDGILSSLIGASLSSKEKLSFCVIGDLAFFYDMNSLGNRHVGSNLRIILINNGKGTEFRQFNHKAASFNEDADEFIAASDHFGKMSKSLVKNYASDLGFEYLSASNKVEFNSVIEYFLSENKLDRSIILEVFTDSELESNALKLIFNIQQDTKLKLKSKAKDILGQKGIDQIKKFTRR